MKKKLLTVCCLIGFAAADAQTVRGQFLDLNNIKARVNADGSLFTDYSNAQFEAPKGSGHNTIFADNLWIGGLDAGNTLKIAAQTYRQTGTDFFPGPLNSLAVADTGAAWNNVWKLNKCDIDAYHNWVLNGSTGALPIDSFALHEIMTWPAMDNDGQLLAPFFDYNGDNIYDPASGADYPLIKGDQAIFFVYNDKGGLHGETGGSSIGVEIQGMAYEFNCPDSALYSTIFVDYKIINKGIATLHDTYIGKWTDFDIGAYNDDYIGSDVTRGAYYGYNGAAIDAGYGANPPAQAVVFLRGPYANANGIDDGTDSTANGTGYGDAVIDNERLGMTKFIAYNNNSSASTGNPVTATEYYDYLGGKWKDGNFLTYGGSGYGGTTNCDYMFPDNSDPVGFGTHGIAMAPWSEVTNGNTPGDRRGLGASGPFTFNAGSIEEVNMAYIFARATSGGNLASLTTMNERIDSIKSQFNRGISTCGCNLVGTGIQDNAAQDVELSVYPNPANNLLYINYTAQSKNTVVEIYDITGQLVKSEKMNFTSAQTIDVSNFATGLYVLKITDGKKVIAQRFLKQ